MFNRKCFIGGCEARSNIEMIRKYSFNSLLALVCLMLSFCLSSCSNDDEPAYWNCLVADSNGEQIWDRYVSAETTEIQATITSNYDWAVNITNKVRVNPSSGNAGTTPITISFEANKANSQRELFFTLRTQTQSKFDREITLIQKGVLHILTNPNTLTLNKEYGKTEISITSNIEGGAQFKVESPDWIKVKYLRSEPDDDGDIFTYFYQLQYNDNYGEVRTGKVVFTSTEHNISNYILIIQNGAKGTPYINNHESR